MKSNKHLILSSVFVLLMLLACKALTLTPEPTLVVPAAEIVILEEVLKKFKDCMSDEGVKSDADTVSFACRNSADTSYTISIKRFGSEASARIQFESDRGENPIQCFHGYDLYETASLNPNNQYIVHDKLGWLAGSRVISVSASYDYSFFHFTTKGFSDAVYTFSVEHKLFPDGTCP